MKIIMKKICLLLLTLLICGCTVSKKYPAREPYSGFSWKYFKTPDIELFVQESKEIKFAQKNGSIYICQKCKGEVGKEVIRVFNYSGDDINNLKGVLVSKFPPENSWDDIKNCKFKLAEKNGQYSKFLLVPQGSAYYEMYLMGQKEPIPYTCAGYGVGNSGMRYFLLSSNVKNKAVFVEIGQEAPLFDENSIKFRF